jgi:two-component system, response regulator
MVRAYFGGNMINKDKCILLVEDNPDDEELTIEALKANRVSNEIIVVRDGQEALDFLFKQVTTANLPQVILMDLKLPKVDGLQVLEQIRKHPTTKLLPVVILTSSKEEQDIVAGYNLGANSYIRKPVDFAQFTEAVRQLSLYWLVLNENPPKPILKEVA